MNMQMSKHLFVSNLSKTSIGHYYINFNVICPSCSLGWPLQIKIIIKHFSRRFKVDRFENFLPCRRSLRKLTIKQLLILLIFLSKLRRYSQNRGFGLYSQLLIINDFLDQMKIFLAKVNIDDTVSIFSLDKIVH